MRPKPSLVTRFKRSRWYSIFWLLIFLVFISAGAIIYYLKVINYSATTTQNNSTQLPAITSNLDTRLRVLTNKASLIASDNFDQAAQLTVMLLSKDGQPHPTDSDTIVTISSNTDSGKFDSGSSVTIPAQHSSASLHYTDTKAGKSTLSFFASGMTVITVTLDIQPAPASSIAPIKLLTKSSTDSLPADSDIGLSATLIDNFGNAVAGGKVTWQQSNPNKTRETITDDTGRSFFMAHFERQDNIYTASVIAAFNSKKQSISLTIRP